MLFASAIGDQEVAGVSVEATRSLGKQRYPPVNSPKVASAESPVLFLS